jgi:hypothetical protein
MSTNDMVFLTNGAERLRLDSSGNLGLGVTPSAWGGGPAYEIQGGSLWANATNGAYFLQNNYFNGSNFIYRTTGQASYYLQGTGVHIWAVAPSGTAGTTTTFTQAMRLDASGNLGVGETSPDTRVHIYGASTAGRGQLYIQGSSTTSRFVMANSSDAYALNTYGDSSTSLVTWDAGSGYSFRWTVADTERARITSGGDLLVGTSSGQVAATVVAYRASSATACVGPWNAATSGDNLFVVFNTEATATQRGSIDYNRAGGLTRYNTTSDYRAKDILGPVANPGAIIDALKVYEGRMKGATQSRPMLVAHEAQEHAPYAVSGTKDEVNDDGTPKYQQMDHASLVPLLIAEIQSLRARVEQLEAK